MADGVVVPELVVVSIERRQLAPVVSTQLPAGAEMPTSAPKLL